VVTNSPFSRRHGDRILNSQKHSVVYGNCNSWVLLLLLRHLGLQLMPRMYCSLEGLLYSPYPPRLFWTFQHSPPDASTSTMTREILVAKGGTVWTRIGRYFCLKLRLPHQFRDLLHAANLRHGTHGFTSLLKEGVLRIFSP